jgi:enterobactin synthetase component F
MMKIAGGEGESGNLVEAVEIPVPKHNKSEVRIRNMDTKPKPGEFYHQLDSVPCLPRNLSDRASALDTIDCGTQGKNATQHAVEKESAIKHLPLAVAQRGMWMGEKIAPKDALYNLAEYCEIFGELDTELFQAAMHMLPKEAETCRVQIVDTDHGPVQKVLDRYPEELPYLDFSGLDDAIAGAEAWMRVDVNRRLDLTRNPLWLCALFKISEQHYFFYQRCHHITLDGFGAGIIARRLADIYNALLDGRELQECGFLELEQQLQEEEDYRQSKRYQRDREYWLDAMSGLPEPLSLASGGKRIGGLCRSSIKLSLPVSQCLREMADQLSHSLPQLMISLLAAYIYRMSSTEDLVFGMPVSARVNRKQRSTPCMMANAVAIRLAMKPDLKMPELLSLVASTVRKALRHQQYRYEVLRRDLGLLEQGQQISWVGVNIEPFDYDLRFGEATTRSHNLSNGTVEDLTIFVYDRGQSQPLRIDLDANPGLYSKKELDEHAFRLCRLIDAVSQQPDIQLGGIDLLADWERHRLLYEWNDTTRPLPDCKVIDLFKIQVTETPEAVAAVDKAEEVSYRELDRRATVLAHALQRCGAARGEIVAVCVSRSIAMLSALLAVQKTGAAYLPLDPEAPTERLGAILNEAKPGLMLGDRNILTLLSSVTPVGTRQVDMEEAGKFSGMDAELSLDSEADSDDPVYVIYTSGSTGRPKGVEITHRNLLNFMMAMQDLLKLETHSRVLAVTTIAFDIATLELYLPLICGAVTVIAERCTARDPKALIQFISDKRVSVVQATPSHWQLLMMEDISAIQGVKALVGGEALPAALAGKMSKLGHPPINLYGPTETTVWSSVMVLDGTNLDAPPIGRPIWNTQLYVLDSARNPVPVGKVGELYIGGEGVAKGYLHRPEMTAERFSANPFGTGRIYRTGDLVRWRVDGVLEYLGRNDFQIKIRGFRVEAGEIEAAIDAWPGVQSSAVILYEMPMGGKQLLAYVLWPDDTESLDGNALRRHLQQLLPDYMVPARIIALSRFPTNVNGKLDRRALPVPEWDAEREWVAPRTELENILADIWIQVLGIEQLSINDSFFDLGGDSMKAAAMVSQLRKRLGRDIPMAALFEATTIAGLAACFEKDGQQDVFDRMLQLKVDLRGTPLFCIHPVLGLGWGFGGLASYLDEKQGIYALQAVGLNGRGELPSSIEEMAVEYISRIREVQGNGPYRLLGWSLGGIVAHEIARQLEKQEEQIAFLGMFDAYPHVTKCSHDEKFNEELAVSGALEFLGFDINNLAEVPKTMEGLIELLYLEYQVDQLPIVAEMQRALPDAGGSVVDNVLSVIENNLLLLRRFTPGVVNSDVLFVQARKTVGTNIKGLLHHNPGIWCRYARSVEVLAVPCRHQEMLDPDALREIGPQLREALCRADRVMWRHADEDLPLCA